MINNSSNVIGLTQMCAEVLMFKSTGSDLMPKGKPASFLGYITEPPKSIVNSVFGRAKVDKPLREVFRWSNIKDGILNFNNLGRATDIDSALGTKKLINRFSARSGFSGMTAMFVASILPDEKDTPETTLKNATLARERPVIYVAQRLGQALWFPVEAPIRLVKKLFNPGEDQHIGEHKRQFAGLGMVSAGFFSILSGFRQIEGKFEHGPQHYMRNPWQMIGGAITTVAGSMLMLGIDNQQGWTNYGNVQFGRILPLIPSIRSRFRPGPHGKPEQGAEWYLGAQGALQFKNVVASLIGGAEKHDGVAIDHKLIRKEAQLEAKARVEALKAAKAKASVSNRADNEPDLVPQTTISQTASVEKAMPERAAEAASAKDAATVTA